MPESIPPVTYQLGGNLAIMLLQGIGRGTEVDRVDIPLYQKAILMLQKMEASTSY